MHTERTTQGSASHRPRLLALLLPSLLVCGCATLSNTEKGLGAGGVIGAGAGAIAGSAVGRPGAGAAIGAGLGAVSGGLIGSAIDESERRNEARIAAATAPQPAAPLGITDVAQLAQQQISDDVIIGQIRATGSAFHLSPQDLVWLKQNGVSDVVIREMQATSYRGPRRVVTAVPVYPEPCCPPHVVVVRPLPPPPPPVSIGFGFGFSSRGRCCR